MNLSLKTAQQKLPSTFIGTVTRIGFYQDTLPKLVITVKKHGLLALPFRNGERVPVTFAINGKCFTAGIRTTDRSATVMISPDLSDAEENPVRLSDVLYNNGWDDKESRVELKIEDGVISFV
jgi:hypothetical protein